MRITRYLSLLDLTVAITVAVAICLPPRSVHAVSPHRGGDAELAALALAEARTFARPQDGALTAELGRRLVAAGQLDWAADGAASASARQIGSPSRWRSMLAASVAHAERLEAEDALEWATRAIEACADAGASACPSWEEVRMQLYASHLDAGVKSGIDAKKDPQGFRRAAEEGLRSIRLKGGMQMAPPKPAPASAVPAPSPPAPSGGSTPAGGPASGSDR